VFSSVAKNYDVMNDLMSAGLHRLWKRFTIGIAAPRPGERVLDVAGGTADLHRPFSVASARLTNRRPGLAHRYQQRMLTVGRDGCSTRARLRRWRNAMPRSCRSE